MKERSAEQPVDAFRAAGVVVMTVAVVFALLGMGIWLVKDIKCLDDAVKLPLLVIAGLVSLIALLAVMAIAFKTVHLANQTQALGLPEGTVRAVIALSLILIFAVVTVYLFSDLSRQDSQDTAAAQPPAATDTANKGANASDQTPTPAATATDPTSKALDAAKTAADAANKAADAAGKATPLSPADTRRQSKLAASQDFAKQLLIMLGTLITSLTSFYFASKAGEATSSKPATPPPAPTLTDVTPATASKDALPAEFTASGSGLSRVNAVSLRSKTGTVDVDPASVLSGDTIVRFKAPKDLAADTWDVIVKSRDGGEATRPVAITITA